MPHGCGASARPSVPTAHADLQNRLCPSFDPSRVAASLLCLERCRQNGVEFNKNGVSPHEVIPSYVFDYEYRRCVDARAVPPGFRADAAKVTEADPTAQALGYKEDATKVDKAKYAKYAAGQDCGNCSFYQGKAADPGVPVRCSVASRWSSQGLVQRL